MTTLRKHLPGGLDAIEARNALIAESFRHLRDDIDLWRFREVLTKLGTELGLSAGAALYALDLTGLLTEADWRGDGRAVTFHSVRTYARKVGKSERTICEYERQLIAAGLVHRTLKHARRHGGQGCEARRTGLDWRAFGARMPGLLERLEERQEVERRRLDIEARIRETRFVVTGLIEGMEESRAEPLRIALSDLGIARLRGSIPLIELQGRFTALLALRSRIEVEAVDNRHSDPQPADRSEEICGLKYTTETPQSPKEICRQEEAQPSSFDTWSAPVERPDCRARKQKKSNTIPLPDIWTAAPAS